MPDIFEAELAQSDHLKAINSFRKTLMSQIACNDSERQVSSDEDTGSGESGHDLEEELQTLSFLR